MPGKIAPLSDIKMKEALMPFWLGWLGWGLIGFFALAVIWSRFGWPLRIKNGQPIGFSVDQVQPFTYRMRQ